MASSTPFQKLYNLILPMSRAFFFYIAVNNITLEYWPLKIHLYSSFGMTISSCMWFTLKNPLALTHAINYRQRHENRWLIWKIIQTRKRFCHKETRNRIWTLLCDGENKQASTSSCSKHLLSIANFLNVFHYYGRSTEIAQHTKEKLKII